ncbi:MAG: 30S ribosome-binding factor RbfA [Desulfobacterales bacterium]
MSYSRADRVGGLIQQTLSEILLREVKDPRLELTTITDVKMTRDLRIARIYFSTPGGPEKIEAVQQGFQSALGFVKLTLARRVGLRYMPDLEFYYDNSFDHGAHIEKLLRSLRTPS